MQTSTHDWFEMVGNKLGHHIYGLLDRDDLALSEHGLLQHHSGIGTMELSTDDARLSELGNKFAEIIDTYHIALNDE